VSALSNSAKAPITDINRLAMAVPGTSPSVTEPRANGSRPSGGIVVNPSRPQSSISSPATDRGGGRGR
jgi:hypothetical protein